jgi:hypothetical protein
VAKEPDKPIKPPKTFLTLVREKHKGAKRYSDEVYAVGPPRSIFAPNVHPDITLPAMRGLLHLTHEQIVAIDPAAPIYEILLSPFRVKPICKAKRDACLRSGPLDALGTPNGKLNAKTDEPRKQEKRQKLLWRGPKADRSTKRNPDTCKTQTRPRRLRRSDCIFDHFKRFSEQEQRLKNVVLKNR